MPNIKTTCGPPHCLICNSRAYSTIHQFNKWDILQCKVCTLVYVDPLPSIRHLINIAEDTHSGMGDAQVKNYHRIRNLEDVHDPVIRSCTETLAMIEQSTAGRTLSENSAQKRWCPLHQLSKSSIITLLGDRYFRQNQTSYNPISAQ